MNKKKVMIGLAGIVIIAGGFFLFSGKKAGGRMVLETEKVGRTSITNVVTATGTVEPVTEVDVGTQVSGIIDKLYVDYNDVVTAGQLIAEMDKVTLEAELQSATAQLDKSKSEYEYQQKNYARSKVLFEKKLISDTEYETATYNYEQAKANYEESQASMVKVRRNLEYATITSPINGVVINKAVEEGQTVAAGFETPTLFTIAADLTKMQIIADVDEADIGSVQDGQRVSFTVDAYPNDVFEGKVEQIRLGESSDSSTSSSSSSSSSTVVTYEVVIFIADASMLEPLGLTVENPTMQAPEGKRLVWVEEGTQLKPKAITVGSSNNNVTEVVDGLQEGEIVAVDLSVSTPVEVSPAAGQERSPFMPGPPDSKKGKK